MEELIYIKDNVESKAVIKVTKKLEFMDHLLNLKKVWLSTLILKDTKITMFNA